MTEEIKFPEFAERISERILAQRTSITKLKDSLGVSYEMVRRYSLGHARPRPDILKKLAQALDCDEVWLLYGSGEEPEKVRTKGKIPVIPWSTAGEWRGIDNLEQRLVDRWLPCPIKCGVDTFALEVTGISMFNPQGKPSFEDGDIIYVDPSLPAVNKSCVVVTIQDDPNVIFKQLIIDNGREYLKSLNPEWTGKIIRVNSEVNICGVVIGKWTEQ